MFVVESLLSFEKGIANCSRIWAFPRRRNSIGKRYLLVVSSFCCPNLTNANLLCLEPVAGAVVGPVPPFCSVVYTPGIEWEVKVSENRARVSSWTNYWMWQD